MPPSSRILTGLCLLLTLTTTAQAQPLHGTPAEVAVWQQRRTDPTYADDWQRIQARAQAFRENPSADLWPGNQTSQPWDAVAVHAGGGGGNHHPGRRRGDGLRDAGFVFLLTGDTSYRDAVRTALLTQARRPGTDFTDRARWARSSSVLDHNNFEIPNWLRKLTYGYSYIRASVPAPEQATLDAWFLQAATYWNTVLDNQIQGRFPNRHRDAYGAPTAQYTPGRIRGPTHAGGPTVYSFHGAWENIPAATNAFVAAVGVLVNDAMLKAHATRFVKEWLMFAVAPEGTVVDQYRWRTAANNPAIGYMYAGTVLGSIVSTVDHLARAGDTTLLDYTTTAGFFGWGGGTKSLRRAVRRYAQITLGERGMANGIQVSTGSQVIGPGSTQIADTWLLPMQRTQAEPLLAQATQRRLPTHPASGGFDPWGGDWGTYPSVRFLFAAMPEGGPGVIPLPPRGPAPRNLRILSQ